MATLLFYTLIEEVLVMIYNDSYLKSNLELKGKGLLLETEHLSVSWKDWKRGLIYWIITKHLIEVMQQYIYIYFNLSIFPLTTYKSQF